MSCELTPTYDICVNQNATFKMTFTLFDDATGSIDITNWTFVGSIRQERGVQPPLLYFTSSVVSIPSGSINFFLGADTTALLTEPRYFYDIIAENPNVTPPETYRLVQGKVSVNLGVTPP